MKESFEEENQKYFDEKKFRTFIVGKDGIKNADDLNEVIEALAEGKLHGEEREEILKQLKASKNTKAALLKAIAVIPPRSGISKKASDVIPPRSGISKKAQLISVWWEVELDCTDDFLFFVKQACEGDYMVAMEVLTVIETIESEVIKDDLKSAQELLSKTINQNPDSSPMLEEILHWVEGRS